jgi:transposase InsO family protein
MMVLTEEQRNYFKNIWTNVNHVASYVGPYKLYQVVKREGKYKIGLRNIRQFLSDLESYSLQKRVHRKFPRRYILTDSIDIIWDGNLQDVRNISKENEGVQYILVLQDIFSRYLFTAPLKQKTASNVIEALKNIFTAGRKPKVLRTDKGSEFKNRWVSAFLKRNGVNQIFTENETKSNFAERSIQNLENRLHRMFSHNQSYEFLSKLHSITDNINNTPSRPLG